MISEQALDALRSTSLFAGFTEEQLHAVPQVGHVKQFADGEGVVAVGASEAHPGLWLVLEGAARVEVGGEALRTIEPGGHFGEMALLTGEPRSADVVAQGDLVAMELTDRHLMALIGRDPSVAVAMLAELARRLCELTASFAETVRRSPEAAAVAIDVGSTESAHEILGPIEYALHADHVM